MEKEMINQLIDTAIHQLKYSYTPYSNFKSRRSPPCKKWAGLHRLQH